MIGKYVPAIKEVFAGVFRNIGDYFIKYLRNSG